MTQRRGLIALGVLLLAAPVGAQQRIHIPFSPPAPAQPFQAPTTADLGRLLSGGTLAPPTSIITAPQIPANIVLDPARARLRTCPMPVLAPDSTRFAKRSAPVRDIVPQDRMPILTPSCENPLRR